MSASIRIFHTSNEVWPDFRATGTVYVPTGKTQFANYVGTEHEAIQGQRGECWQVPEGHWHPEHIEFEAYFFIPDTSETGDPAVYYVDGAVDLQFINWDDKQCPKCNSSTGVDGPFEVTRVDMHGFSGGSGEYYTEEMGRCNACGYKSSWDAFVQAPPDVNGAPPITPSGTVGAHGQRAESADGVDSRAAIIAGIQAQLERPQRIAEANYYRAVHMMRVFASVAGTLFLLLILVLVTLRGASAAPMVGGDLLYIPGSTWLVEWEDLPASVSDWDYDDYIAEVEFGENHTFRYVSSRAAYDSIMCIGSNCLAAQPGSSWFELPGFVDTGGIVFARLHVLESINTFWTGTQNARVEMIRNPPPPPEVPEPATALSMLVGVVLLGVAIIARRKTNGRE